MICPHCHSQNPDGNKVCRICGNPLTTGAASMAKKTAGKPLPPSKDQAASEVQSPVMSPRRRLWLVQLPLVVGLMLMVVGVWLTETIMPNVVVLVVLAVGAGLSLFAFVALFIADVRKKQWGAAVIVIFLVLYYFGVPIFRTVTNIKGFDARLNQAEQAWNESRNEDVVTNAKKALELAGTDKERAIAYYWLGLGNFVIGNRAEAVKNEQEMLRLNPELKPFVAELDHRSVFEAAIVAAQAGWQEGHDEAIVTSAAKALASAQTDEERATAYYWVGVGNYLTGHRAEAIKNEQEMLRLNPKMTPLVAELDHRTEFDAIISATRTAWQESRDDDIVVQATKALTIAQSDDERATANYWLGLGTYRQGKLAEAEKYEQAAIDLSPREVGPYTTMGTIKLAERDVVSARRYAEQAMTLDPTYEWAQNLMGLVLMVENKPAQAIPYFEQALKLSPQTAVFQQHLDQAKALAPVQ